MISALVIRGIIAKPAEIQRRLTNSQSTSNAEPADAVIKVGYNF